MVKDSRSSMAPTRRSSARLQASTTPHKQFLAPASASKLSTLVERDETPSRGTLSTLNSIAASAPAKATSLVIDDDTTLTTPTAPRIRPSIQDMHPSRHQSTAKKIQSARLSGYINAHAPAQSPSSKPKSNRRESEGAEHGASSRNPFSSPDFEFRFTRPSTELSREAQRMMDEVREHAAKIRSELTMQRDESDGPLGSGTTPGRKVMNAKGRMGRFSDVHMEQFKKMNSIANHPSSFRADASKSSPATKSLKRSNSKAGLDKTENDLKRSPSARSECTTVPRAIASPTKRMRNNNALLQAPSWHLSNSAQKATLSTSLKHSSEHATPRGVVSTPTKPGLTRSASVKSMKSSKSKIPSLARSPSAKVLSTPQAWKSVHPATDGKIRSTFTDKLISVKSILRRPQFKFSDDPVKLAAGTHISTPERTNAAGKDKLPNVLDETLGSPAHRKEKHVNFSSSPDVHILSSPIQTAQPATELVQYPSLPDAFEEVFSPTNPTAKARTSAPGPSDFTFRADQTIRFAPPHQTTPTIRHIRASDTSVIHGAAGPIFAGLPSVPHGLSNKKRKHVSVDEDDDDTKENVEMPQDVDQSPTKKVKVMPGSEASPTKMTQSGKLKTPTKGLVSGSKRRGILTLSRLNALSRPKKR